MKPTCFSCSAVSSPSRPVEQQPRQRQDRVQRRAELVAHVGQEARLQLVGAAQVVGLLVELGVQRDHAAVGVLQLAVEPRRARPGARAARRARAAAPGSAAAPPRAGSCGAPAASVVGDAARARRRVDDGRRARQQLRQRDRGAAARRRCRCRSGPSAAARRRCRGPCRSASGSARRGRPRGRRCPGPRSRHADRAGAAARLALDRELDPPAAARTGRRCGRSPTPRWRCASGPAASKPSRPAIWRARWRASDHVVLVADRERRGCGVAHRPRLAVPRGRPRPSTSSRPRA